MKLSYKRANTYTYTRCIIAMCLLLCLLTACGNSGDNSNPTTSSAETTMAELIESTEALEEETSVPEDNSALYAEDDVVNRFVYEFNENAAFEITNITKGNVKTKYFGDVNNRYIEMINANNAGAEAFCLTINGGQEKADEDSMFEVFREVVKILDPAITDENIDAVITDFDTKDILLENYAIGDSISVTYVPTKELSYGKTECRIDISAFNYK